MSTEEKKDLKTIVDKATRKVLKVTPHYVLLEPTLRWINMLIRYFFLRN